MTISELKTRGVVSDHAVIQAIPQKRITDTLGRAIVLRVIVSTVDNIDMRTCYLLEDNSLVEVCP